MKACVNCDGRRRRLLRPEQEPGAQARGARRQKALVPENYIQRVIQFARQGYTEIEFPIYDTDWDSEAYLTVAGQNSNNSVRVTDEFLERRREGRRLEPDRAHHRQGGEDAEGARPLGDGRLRRLGLGRSRHPVPHHHQRLAHLRRRAARSAPPTRARSTCSSTTRPAISPRSTCSSSATREKRFDVAAFEHAVRLWTIVLEISVHDGAVPVEEDRRALLRATARSASATPISAAS